MPQGYFAYVIPVIGERPDNSLPGGGWSGNYPSQGLPVYPSTGPVFPGFGGPVDPGWGVTPPVDPGYGRPVWGPHPGNRPPGSWTGRPDNSLPGQGGERPDNSLPGGPPVHPWLPGAAAGPRPSQPIYYPDKPLPGEPGGGGGGDTKPPGIENLPPIIIWIPGYGWIRALPGVPEKPHPEGPEPK